MCLSFGQKDSSAEILFVRQRGKLIREAAISNFNDMLPKEPPYLMIWQRRWEEIDGYTREKCE